MNTKTLSPRAFAVIDQYLHFKVGSAVASVPYFNNKTAGIKGSLAVNVGKGNPKEILDEIDMLLTKNHIAQDGIADESLKKLLIDNHIGIDCSGFAYYVLNAESEARGAHALNKHLHFAQAFGLKGMVASRLWPARNAGVITFIDDRNSRIIPLSKAAPGDIITMVDGPDGNDRNHILIIHQVEYRDSAAIKLYYSHAAAYPEDGLYGSGIKQGVIEIADTQKSLAGQEWSESGRTASDNPLWSRAAKSKTELRRLSWF